MDHPQQSYHILVCTRQSGLLLNTMANPQKASQSIPAATPFILICSQANSSKAIGGLRLQTQLHIGGHTST